VLPVTDYDLYIHKDSNTGPVVATSGRGATSPTEPLTYEDTTIDPSITGTGVYTTAFFLSSSQTLRVKFDDTASPAPAIWDDVSATNTSLVSLDPILYTDSHGGPNRTFVSELAGKASLMSFTDDDGANWTISQGSGINSGVDHQTIGGGPYAKNPDGSLKD